MNTANTPNQELPLSEKTWFRILMLILFWPIGLYLFLRTEKSKQEDQNRKLSEKTWFHILMLVVFWPVGLYFFWTTKRYPKKVRFGPAIVLASLVLLGIVASIAHSAALMSRDYKFTVTLADDTPAVSSASKVERISRKASEKAAASASSSSAVSMMVNQGRNSSEYGKQAMAMAIGAYVSDSKNEFMHQIFLSEAKTIPAGTKVDIIHLYAIYQDGHIDSEEIESDTAFVLIANSETGEKLGVIYFSEISDLERIQK
jgi:hypothetical protein